MSIRFIKAQASALVATAADFVIYAVLAWLGLFYWFSVLISALAGGLLNFQLNRHWSFAVSEHPAYPQAGRYAMVCVGSALLNAGLIYLTVDLLRYDPYLMRIACAVLVGVAYNYPLHRHFVFAPGAAER